MRNALVESSIMHSGGVVFVCRSYSAVSIGNAKKFLCGLFPLFNDGFRIHYIWHDSFQLKVFFRAAIQNLTQLQLREKSSVWYKLCSAHHKYTYSSVWLDQIEVYDARSLM